MERVRLRCPSSQVTEHPLHWLHDDIWQSTEQETKGHCSLSARSPKSHGTPPNLPSTRIFLPQPVFLVFLNHYLDLAEAIEDENPEAVDYSAFQDTDIPTEITLPSALHLAPPEHEEVKGRGLGLGRGGEGLEVKEYVLALSVDKAVQRELSKDRRGVYEAQLGSAKPCILTGYPVLGDKKEFGTSGVVANKEDWNKLLLATKTGKMENLEDVLGFIASYTGSNITMAL